MKAISISLEFETQLNKIKAFHIFFFFFVFVSHFNYLTKWYNQYINTRYYIYIWYISTYVYVTHIVTYTCINSLNYLKNIVLLSKIVFFFFCYSHWLVVNGNLVLFVEVKFCFCFNHRLHFKLKESLESIDIS